MTDSPHADRGSIVTFLDSEGSEHSWFCQAVVTGSGVIDPETDVDWVPIVRPDGELTLLDPALIVTTEPARTGNDAEPEPPRVVDILAGALAVLAEGMTDLDELAPMAPQAASVLLRRFAEQIMPIEYALCVLVDANPMGRLATVLSGISSAVDQFEHGHVADGKAGILIANNAMAGLVEPEPDDPL